MLNLCKEVSVDRMFVYRYGRRKKKKDANCIRTRDGSYVVVRT